MTIKDISDGIRSLSMLMKKGVELDFSRLPEVLDEWADDLDKLLGKKE